jgi:hypothetical protein
MNAEELKRNPVLTEFAVKDLNEGAEVQSSCVSSYHTWWRARMQVQCQQLGM